MAGSSSPAAIHPGSRHCPVSAPLELTINLQRRHFCRGVPLAESRYGAAFAFHPHIFENKMTFSRRNFLAGGLGLLAATAVLSVRAGSTAEPVAAIGEEIRAKSTDGLNLSARVYGPEGAPEILFLHGLGQSRLAWTHQVHALSDRFRLVTWDFRGHGDSDRPASIAAYADAALWACDVQAVIAAAGLRRPTLVGWSLGGYVAGQYLARYGDGSVAGVNLVDAVTKFDYALFGSAGLQYSPDMTSPDLAERTAAIAGFLGACFAQPPAASDFNQMLVYNGMVPPELHAAVGQLSAEGMDTAFAAVQRMLVTYGAKDVITTREMSRRILDLNPRAQLSVYEESGHAPFYEEHARFNGELAAFAAG